MPWSHSCTDSGAEVLTGYAAPAVQGWQLHAYCPQFIGQ